MPNSVTNGKLPPLTPQHFCLEFHLTLCVSLSSLLKFAQRHSTLQTKGMPHLLEVLPWTSGWHLDPSAATKTWCWAEEDKLCTRSSQLYARLRSWKCHVNRESLEKNFAWARLKIVYNWIALCKSNNFHFSVSENHVYLSRLRTVNQTIF